MHKVLVIWARFGPYHLSRLRAAGELLSKRGVSLYGLEIAQTDQVYGWSIASQDSGFVRHTIFANFNYANLSSWTIAHAVTKTLSVLTPDVVFVNGWGTSEALASLAWCKSRHKIAVLMSETKADEQPRRWWKEWFKARLVRRFDAAFVGGALHKSYVVDLGMSANRVFLGYDVVDNDYFRAEAQRVRNSERELRAKYHLPEQYFFANCRFIERKNLDGLLRGYLEYRRMTQNPWGLVVSGSGEERDGLGRLASELGLADVRWPGFVQYDELPVFYGLAGAFVHPAKSEPWGLVINEACASGLPVLVSQTCGAGHELVREGENGFVFDPLSDAEIARALTKVASLIEAQRHVMGDRSHEIVSHWGPNRFAQGFLQAIQVSQARRGGSAY